MLSPVERNGSQKSASKRRRFDRIDRSSGKERDSVRTPAGLPDYVGIPAFGVLQHAAEQLPDRRAVIYGDQSWSYRDLNADSIRCAAMLQRLGVRPGDRVAVLLPNVPEYIIAVNGIWRAGGIVLALSPLMVAEEIDGLLEATKCRFVIALDLLTDLFSGGVNDDEVRAGGQRTTLLVSIRKHLPAAQQIGYLCKLGYQWLRGRPNATGHSMGWFWDQMNQVDGAWQPISIDAFRDPAYILPTGGTTGKPKAVTLSHQNLVANAWQQYAWIDHSFGEQVMLAVLPFFHSYGMSATLMSGAMMGATLVLHHRFNAAQVIRLIAQHRPTVLHAVPAMLVALNSQLEKAPARLDSLRWVISGGAPLKGDVARRFAEHTRWTGSDEKADGALIVEGYGLSEASPVTHVGHLFRPPRYGVIGLPLPHTESRIVSAEDGVTEVPLGEVGELLVRGPQVMLGYWSDAGATRDAITDGWLHTGDLAVGYPDGYYAIVGRKKDLIITSGFNVFPSEVESVLQKAAGVKDVAVVGEPDEQRGEIVVAYIVPEDGTKLDENALISFCQQHLSKHKRPRKFVPWKGDLPKNFLGKIIRRQLRELAAKPVDAAEDTSPQES